MGSEEAYKKKRDLDKTPEPSSTLTQKNNPSGNSPVFVIQKHVSSNLHYDLRLEIDGTLKSWAVPKGPSTNPSEKRLAVPVEDHPLDYADFEGVIPEGQYGAGTVMIWDKGSYDNLEKDDEHSVPMQKCYENGRIEVFLNGEKISGGYALIESKNLDDNWLLIKMKDEYADARRNPTNTKNRSVETGRTLDEIYQEES